MKKVLGIISVLVLLVLLTGCGITNTGNSNVVKEAPAKGNCSILDCIYKLDIKDNLEKVNQVMGFDGELVREGSGYSTYNWVIDEEKEESVEVTFYSSSASITLKFKDDLIKNSKVDFSEYNDIKKALNNRESLKYEDIKAKFKAEGTLIEKSSSGNKYRWVNEEGRYLNASFGATTGSCTMIIGRI